MNSVQFKCERTATSPLQRMTCSAAYSDGKAPSVDHNSDFVISPIGAGKYHLGVLALSAPRSPPSAHAERLS
jgi:hypothetical protein